MTGKGYRPRVADLGRWRYLTGALMLVYFCLVMLVPLLMMAWASLLPFYSAPSAEALRLLTSKNYSTVLSYPSFADAMRNTVVLGLGAATVVMLLMAVTAWTLSAARAACAGCSIRWCRCRWCSRASSWAWPSSASTWSCRCPSTPPSGSC